MIDVFRVGVSLAFESNAAGVLGVMLRDLVKVEGAVGALRKEFAALKPVAIGALSAFAGYAIVRGIWDMVRAGNKLNEELNKTALLGGEFATRLDDIKQAAFRIHFQVPNIAPSEAVHIMREIAPQMQRPEDAIAMGAPMARMAAVLGYFTGQGHDMGADALRDVVRTVEMRRRLYKKDPVTGEESIDLEAFRREANAMERGIILSQGMLKPRDFLLMTRQAGPAGMMQDPTTFYALMGELSVAMGAQRAGTAMTSLFQQFAGGVMTQRVAREMTRMGVLQPGEWHPQKGGGGGVLLEPEAQKRLSEAIRNPFDYIQRVLVPQLESQGKKGMDLLTEVFLLFGRQTTQRFVSEIAMGGPQWARTMKMFPEVADPETAQKMLHQRSLTWSLGELSSSWQGLMEVLSEQNINPFIMVVHGLTDAINWLAKEAIAHPAIAKWLVDIGLGLSSLAVVLGTMAVIRFLVISSGLRGMVGALTGLSGVGFGTITGGLWGLFGILTKLSPILAAIAVLWPKPAAETKETLPPGWGWDPRMKVPIPPGSKPWPAGRPSDHFVPPPDFGGQPATPPPAHPLAIPPPTGGMVPPVGSPWDLPRRAPTAAPPPPEHFQPVPPSGMRVPNPMKDLPPDWQKWENPNLSPSSYHGAAPGGAKVYVVQLVADGRQLAQVVLDHAGRLLSGPATGTFNVDPRAIPENPGAWA